VTISISNATSVKKPNRAPNTTIAVSEPIHHYVKNVNVTCTKYAVPMDWRKGMTQGNVKNVQGAGKCFKITKQKKAVPTAANVIQLFYVIITPIQPKKIAGLTVY
jgi:hypothetical protein